MLVFKTHTHTCPKHTHTHTSRHKDLHMFKQEVARGHKIQSYARNLDRPTATDNQLPAVLALGNDL